MTEDESKKRTPLDRGVRFLVVYKFVKACAQAVGAVLLFGRWGAQLGAHVAAFAAQVEAHAVHAVTRRIAGLLMGLGRADRVRLIALALALDAVVSAVEGWLLRRGSAWGRWLVVAGTSALLPWEAFEFVHHPSVGRALLIIGNATVVVYLVLVARRHVREAAAASRR